MENKLFHSDRSLDFIMNNNLVEETILGFVQLNRGQTILHYYCMRCFMETWDIFCLILVNFQPHHHEIQMKIFSIQNLIIFLIRLFTCVATGQVLVFNQFDGILDM